MSAGRVRVRARRRARRPIAALCSVAAGLVASGLLVLAGTNAAFTASTTTTTSVTAGTVSLSNDASASWLFDPAALVPGSTGSECVDVDYTGTLAARIRLYPTGTSGTLAPYLHFAIEQGTGGSLGSCAGFTPARTLWTGTLAALAGAASGWPSGLGGYDTRTAGHDTYRFTYLLDPATPSIAQASTASTTFRWESRDDANGSDGRPGPPTGVTATPAAGRLDVSWSAPASPGSSAITRYTASAMPGGVTCTPVPATGTSCSLTGLVPGVGYTVTVAATNAQGTGPGSVVTTATPAASAYAGAVLADGPIGFWRLGESGGPTALDQSLTSNAGYSASGVTFGQAGPDQQGAVVAGLDGVAGSARVPAAASAAYNFAGTSPYTVEAWVKRPNRPESSFRDIVTYLYRVSPSDKQGWDFSITDDNVCGDCLVSERWGGAYDNGGADLTSVGGSTRITPDVWHHVAMTYDGGTVRLYLDGQLDGSGADTRAAGSWPSVGLTIGYRYNGVTSTALAGSLADVAVYPRALTQAQLQAHIAAR